MTTCECEDRPTTSVGDEMSDIGGHEIDRVLWLNGMQDIPMKVVGYMKENILFRERRERRIPNWLTPHIQRFVIGISLSCMALCGLILAPISLVIFTDFQKGPENAIGVVAFWALYKVAIMLATMLGLTGLSGLPFWGYEIPFWRTVEYDQYLFWSTGEVMPKIPEQLKESALLIKHKLPEAVITIDHLAFTKDPFIYVSYEGETRCFGHW